jgi:hypothetical protein
MDHVSAFIGVEMQKDLGIAGGLETVTFQFQSPAKFKVIIYFTVKNDYETAVLVPHGLTAGVGKVYDGQAAMTERNTVVRGVPFSSAVRTTLHHVIAYANQLASVHVTGRRSICKDGYDSAHD